MVYSCTKNVALKYVLMDEVVSTGPRVKIWCQYIELKSSIITKHAL